MFTSCSKQEHSFRQSGGSIASHTVNLILFSKIQSRMNVWNDPHRIYVSLCLCHSDLSMINMNWVVTKRKVIQFVHFPILNWHSQIVSIVSFRYSETKLLSLRILFYFESEETTRYGRESP